MAASAVAQPSAGGKVPMRIADARVAFDRPVVAHGRLARADAGRELILEYRDAAGAWQPLASAVVAGDGRWRVSATLPHTAPVRVTLHGAPGAATASSDPRHSSERTIAVTARVRVGGRRLHVEAGRRAAVRGRVLPAAAGRRVALQMRRGGRWVTLDRGRTRADGAYRLRRRVPTALEARVRVVVARSPGLSQARRPVGRLKAYRYAHASWYGPGFYGQRTGCGGRLGYSQYGVAHKTLPCGTKVTLRHRGRTVRVPVIDRGPYVGGREYDLTAVTARRLHFRGHGPILVTR